MTQHELYIRHCFFLARKGIGHVSPNPPVGALIVHGKRIIGQGYHRAAGGSHAEIEAIHSVATSDRNLLRESTLYVSLEPCNHRGKTPPCTDRILKEQIPTVAYACQDPNPYMAGRSLELLKNAGVRVIGPLCEAEGRTLIRPFEVFVLEKRPYVVLKFAQSADFFLGTGKRTKISNPYSDMLVHKWRSQTDAILVGKNTVLVDNPLLTTRSWIGKNPARIILGHMDKSKHTDLRILGNDAETLIAGLEFPGEKTISLPRLLSWLYGKGIQSILVEGGANTLSAFISAGLWDEARVIQSRQIWLENGIKAPQIRGRLVRSYTLASDLICIYSKN
ncbi:MAG: bifunctional diaminohydroxyphosphoribosylaminopyrimidine deaminase/5-amino-6-(5-phosphoribosylamino)uracil reductase RibD [Saprospiraceae bacterium]|jgi:diaminohydroxyphosphoribosylaminopyrimidine deaminase/5-amino-6-(5-phosphoribosylamino)uracil reductase|nr:bifunctional diaminohydroxyphosphoribosylaminopyrimidine deaminase/5-amino-6-(5-phosphoribosylamino)uracil reductase RibD [Saprospiraceae bacterium]MBP9211029.1 bifunctional diaminohydroxyphosphoribosylaminopyrimidine deaminase/5-amino-6-(5-phosphoribosylamino)uracil reductase RibD [Saprospiraceae bacterium]MBV6473122.1 Riboflavin biosynthesis protein RibD [Saprospiraceae bacterium]